MIMNKTSANNSSYRWLILNTDDKMYFTYYQDAAGGTASQSKCDTAFGAGDVGVWRHVAVTIDVSAQAFTFYIDGVAKADTVTVSNASSIYDCTDDFQVGANYTETTGYFDGQIDDLRFWDDIRTGAEVLANKDKELVGNETNLIGYWKLNNNYTDDAKSSDLTGVNTPVFTTDIAFGAAYLKPKRYW